MTVLRVNFLGQYFCLKHHDLNITAQEKILGLGQVSLPMENYSPLSEGKAASAFQGSPCSGGQLHLFQGGKTAQQHRQAIEQLNPRSSRVTKMPVIELLTSNSHGEKLVMHIK